MVRKSRAPSRPAGGGSRPGDRMSQQNVEARFEPTPHGGGTLRLRYRGPFARRPLWVHFGERRSGREWIAPRDVPMASGPDGAAVTIACEPGEPLEGACFAFFTRREGVGLPESWDNGGRPFGYYGFDLESGLVESR